MHWYNENMNGWGYPLMTISMLAFWGLVIFSVVLLLRRPARATRTDAAQTPSSRTPEQLLAERFARGEIDEREYTNRLDTLRAQVLS